MEANLKEAYLSGADFREADLRRINLQAAILPYSHMNGANLTRANLEGANLENAYLVGTNLCGANLQKADLTNSDISNAILVESDLRGAKLQGCRVYGCSTWNITLTGTQERDLIISRRGDPEITVDNLEVAQFIYLLLNNNKIRRVIETVTSKVVLILGRFTPERKDILDAIRDALRSLDYLPILFDFDRPASRDITETVSLLAHMSRFVIADITDAKSIPQELQLIVPNLPSVPVQPLLLATQSEYGMFEHFKRYPWVLPTFIYNNENELLKVIKDKAIGPAETKAKKTGHEKT